MTTPSTAHQGTPAAHTEEFEVLLISDERDPGFAVFCPSLPGCNSQGDDREDALAMIADAIQGFLLPPRARKVGPVGEKERLIAELTADGCKVEVALVSVSV